MANAAETLWQAGPHEIVIAGPPDAGWRDYVRAASFGVAAPRYTRLNLDTQLARFHAPRALSLRERGRTIGSYLLDTSTGFITGRFLNRGDFNHAIVINFNNNVATLMKSSSAASS